MGGIALELQKVHIININIQLNYGKVTIPKHARDLAPKTLNSILKQAGLK